MYKMFSWGYFNRVCVFGRGEGWGVRVRGGWGGQFLIKVTSKTIVKAGDNWE